MVARSSDIMARCSGGAGNQRDEVGRMKWVAVMLEPGSGKMYLCET